MRPRMEIMGRLSKIVPKVSDLKMSCRLTNAVAMALFIAAVMFIMSACQRKPVMAHSAFYHFPSSGWLHNQPVVFVPEYDDSVLTYNLVLAVRHNNSYRHRNLSLVVDLIAADTIVARRAVNMPIADEYGNWKGGGFGTLYQDTVTIAEVIDPGDACRVVVWQTMEGCDTLNGLVNLGLITRPLTN